YTIIDRPAELATDTATTDAVMLHAIEQLDCDVLCTLQATSPLTSAQQLRDAWAQFQREGRDSMVTDVPTGKFIWTLDGKPLNYDPQHRPMRQQFAGTVMENGAFYFTKRELLLRTQCRLGGSIGVFVMPPEADVELDEPADWDKLATLLTTR
ncbi:MAG TPA: acylneuraminate cytidylyltransferase, partial [bacterium]|nr:acylneuraminate cytidylyltransferase [bacterium]